jgi:glycosylphosphatidylinositol transamidase (GPIT) subunit GPI8
MKDVLTGKSSKNLPKVIQAKSTDNVFVFWSGHGTPGYLEYGKNKISYEQIISFIKQIPHRKVLVAVEACYSGGLGETAEKADIPGIVFLTAASPYETSKAAERDEEMGVYLSNYFTRGFMELLAEQPDATLRNVYIELASKISGSHVQLYNVKNYGNIYKETMGEFFVVK